MDKLFTFNRYTIGFCAVLIVAVFARNYARDQRILEEAKVIGRQEAEWSWPSQGICTNVDDIQAKILKLTENDAEVEVEGKQKIIVQPSGQNDQANSLSQVAPGPTTSSLSDTTSTSDFKAVLTLYKSADEKGDSRIWTLGKVEGK